MKMLHEDFHIDESDEKDMTKDLEACDCDSSSDEDSCYSDGAGSSSKNDSNGETLSLRQYTAKTERRGPRYCAQEQCVPILQT